MLIEKMLDKALKLFLMLALGGGIQTVSAVLSICREGRERRGGRMGRGGKFNNKVVKLEPYK